MPKHVKTIGLLIFIPLLFCSNIFGEYSLDRWTTENGLPHNTVRKIVQTPDGYLWVTTFDGLARFDGVRFTVFNSINTKEITDNRFFDAFVEDDGTLWASMLNGSVISYKNGEFTSFQIKDPIKITTILSFEKDVDGNLMANNTFSGNVYLVKNNELVLVTEKQKARKISQFFSKSGKLWKFTDDGVTEEISGRFMKYLIPNIEKPNQKPIKTYFEDKTGSLWLGTKGHLYKLSNGRVNSYRFPVKQRSPEDKNFNPYVFPHFEDGKGNIWVRVRFRQNTYIYSFKNGEIDFTERNLAYTLKTESHISIFKDMEDFTWVASVNGITRLRKKAITTISDEEDLWANHIYPIYERKNGEILIGASNQLRILKKGKFTNTKPGQIATAFAEDKKGRLWIASNGKAAKRSIRSEKLVVYENNVKKFLSSELGREKPVIWIIKPDSQDNIWLGTTKGLIRLRNDRFVARYTQKDGLLSNDISFIHESKNGVIWLGTAKGIAKFENEEFKTYTTKDGLAGNRIRTIYEDNSGTLWIGTYGNGLSRFKNGEFFNFSTNEGLYHNGVFQIFEDENETFWIGGNQGIYRVAKKDLNHLADGKIKQVNSIGYGKEDGMLNVEVNGGRHPAGIRASDGKFWFPTMGGVAIIDPNNIKENRKVPNAIIEDVTIEREKAGIRNGVKVGVGKDDIEIHYTAPSFIKPKQIRFKYKLDGFNDDWIEAGTRRTAYFSYLPPGDYTFRLLVSNSDGVWNEKETTIAINVLAPFYRTNWFFAALILATIAVAFLLYRYRVGLLKKRNAEQMAFSQKLISTQEDERKRIAAGLHDSLGQHLIVIKNWATLALGEIDKKSPAREQVSEISDTSLQALKEVREIVNDLRPHQIEAIGLTDTIKSMIEQIESASGINFTLEYDKIDHLFSKDDEVTFYRVIQEYVNNIVKHSEAENAYLSIRNGSNRIKVKISDDGKGFNLPDEKLEKIGFGLTGIEERLNMIGGIQSIESELGKGTAVDLEFELN